MTMCSLKKSLLVLCLIVGQSALAATTVKTEKFENGVVSREESFEDNILQERRYFDIQGVLRSWVKFQYLPNKNVVVYDLSVSSEKFGRIEIQEEWSGLDDRNVKVSTSRLVRKWHYDKEQKLEYVGVHEQQEPFREIQKDYYNNSNQKTSSIYMYYKGSDEKPYAFIEKGPQGQTLSEFSLYEPYNLEASLQKVGKTPDEIAIYKKQRQSKKSFLIAIIDSGFDYNHAELVSKWWDNPSDPIDGIDNDGNGWVDDNFGWDQVRNVGLPTESSIGIHKDHRPLSHGTHVAHIATDDLHDVGLIGFAGDYTRPDYVKKMSEFLKIHKVRIVNLSLGFPADTKDMLGLRDGIRAYKEMIEANPNTLFVVASGNAESDLDNFRNKQYPASFNHPNVLKVGALTASRIEDVTPQNAKMAEFSNFGQRNVDILAPGVDVLAASLGGGLIKHSGTSMATPYMVNLAARLWKEVPELTAAEVRTLFIETAQKTTPVAPIVSGGYADLKAALLKAKMGKLQKQKNAAVEGPNCWNSATYLAGVSQGVHHTFANEFANVLSSPLCQEVSAQQAQAGDIVGLRRVNQNGKVLPVSFISEVHGYTVVDQSVGFTKNGVMAEAEYQLQAPADIFTKYKLGDMRECKKFGVERKDCQLKEMVYRCQGLEQFMQARGGLNIFEKDVLLKFGKVEKLLEQYFLKGAQRPSDKDVELEQLAALVQMLKGKGSSAVVIEYFESRLESLSYR